MTREEVINKKDELDCFYCYSNLKQYQNILIIETLEGVVEIKNAKGKIQPLVYCCSDCMYYECHLRYSDRVAKGTFRRVEVRELKPGELPKNWQGEPVELVK
jgi:hypothetical protein